MSRRKKNPEKRGQYKQPLGKLQVFQHSHHSSDREEKEQEIKNLFEKIMKENFPNLVKGTNIQVQKAQRVPNKMYRKRITPRYIISKMTNVKDKKKIVKAAREKKRVTYKGVPIRLSAGFSKETLQARRVWQEVLK